MSLLLAWILHISAYTIKLSGPFLIHDWTRRVPLVVQEFRILPEHLSSPLVFSGVRVTRSLVLCVLVSDRCLSLCLFSFGHCIVCPSSIYAFWLPLWYLLAIVLSALLRFTDSDYPFGIFSLLSVLPLSF